MGTTLTLTFRRGEYDGAHLLSELGQVAGSAVYGTEKLSSGRVMVTFADDLDVEAQEAVRDWLQTTIDAEIELHRLARNALSNNRSFLNLSSPTNAQNAAQLKALTRQMNYLIRIVIGDLDGSD